MQGRIVEIAQDDQYLSVHRGFLVVSHKGIERARIALSDVGALIGNAHGLAYSNNLIVRLAGRGIPTVFCAQNHRPVAIVWPIDSHYQLAGRIRAQIATKLPTRKRLWKQIVERKLLEQARLLEAIEKPHKVVHRLACKVRSGDRDNLEAQAARQYWRILLGPAFRRDADEPGVNALLNYGYAVLRATTARAVAAVGLHPSIGLFHRSGENAFQLVDDLMEPFRPTVDATVLSLLRRGCTDVTKQAKRALALSMYVDRTTKAGATPLSHCIEIVAQSLVSVFQAKSEELVFPDLQSRDELSAYVREGTHDDEPIGVQADVDACNV